MGKKTLRKWSFTGFIPALIAVIFLSGIGLAASSAQSSTTQSSPAPSSQAEDIARVAKDKENNLNNRQREINDIKRDVKSGLDTSKVEGLFSRYATCISELKACPATVTDDNYSKCWDKNRDCDDIDNSINDEFQDVLYPIRDCANNKKGIEDRKREKKNNIDRQLKEILRSDKETDVSALNTIVNQIDAALTQAGQISSGACNRDVSDQLSDISQDLNGYFQDWYSVSGEIQEKANEKQQLKDASRNIKDKERGLKDMQRELTRQTKQLGETNESVFALKQLVADYQASLERAKQCISANDAQCFWDENTVMDDANRSFWDVNQETNELSNKTQQTKDCSRQLKDRQRVLKDLEREYQRVVKGSGENAELKAHLDAYRTGITEAGTALQTGAFENCWDDLFNPLQEHESEFRDLMNTKGRILGGDFQRWIKDVTREWTKDRPRQLKDLEREAKRGEIPQETVESLKQLLAQAQALLEEVKQGMSAGDSERVEDILNLEIQDIRVQWDDTMGAVFDARQEQFSKFEMKNLADQIEEAKRRIEREGPERCLDYANRALEIISHVSSGKDEKAMQELESLGGEVNRDDECASLYEGVGEGPVNVREFVKEFDIQGVGEDQLNAIVERISQDLVNKVLGQIATRLDEAVLQKLTSVQDAVNQQRVSAILEFAATDFVPEEFATELVENKAEFFDLARKVSEMASRPGCEGLGNLKAKVESAALVGDSADQLRELIAEFTEQNAGASGQACKNAVNSYAPKIDQILARGQEEAYEKRVIPFKDTGADQYYAGAVAELAQRGIVAGKFDASGRALGVFDPAAKVKVTEILKMIFEAAGLGKARNAPSVCNGKYRDHWASGYIAQAENSGFEIVSSCSDLNRDATRAEVVQMILEAASVVPPRGDYVGYANQLGIIKGGPDGNLRPKDTINRAEAATVLKRAIGILSEGE